MKVVDFERSGGPDLLRVKDAPKPTFEIHEMLIQVAAAGLNIYDTLDRRRIPYPYNSISNLGYECSGKVVAVGSFVGNFEVGDEVCVILEGGGGCAEFIAVPQFHALKIPPKVSLAEAATLPQASCLTLYALSMLTNIATGKTILIHGDAGGIDIIAIQYAKYVGCEVIAVAGMEEKLRLCKTLGAEVCINYNKQDFCKCVKAETGEKGVDIILDASGRAHFQKNLDCLAIGGSLVILGSNSGSQVNIDLSVLMHKDINVVGKITARQYYSSSLSMNLFLRNVIGGDLRSLFYTEVESIFSDAAAKIWPLIESGHIKPTIGKEFTFSEATEAYRALVGHSVAGKILLVPQ